MTERFGNGTEGKIKLESEFFSTYVTCIDYSLFPRSKQEMNLMMYIALVKRLV